jgi:hypothetical protein
VVIVDAMGSLSKSSGGRLASSSTIVTGNGTVPLKVSGLVNHMVRSIRDILLLVVQ